MTEGRDIHVLPSNTMQLINALEQTGKSIDVQVGPDRSYSGIGTDWMMEFFIEALALNGNDLALAIH